jgi:hypothetical protein
LARKETLMFTQLKVIIAGAILLAVLIIAGLIYWRGSSNANTKNDLRVAREVIKTERETLKVTSQIDMRVNAEGIQTANTAQEATREIEAIRTVRREAPVGRAEPTAPVPVHELPADAARVLQLAREARAAAVASSAKLQPARAGAR